MTANHASWRLCIAPMMDRTDRHCRFMFRALAPGARLYTEMVTASAVVNGDAARLLMFDRRERPLALQLGGSDPELLIRAADVAAKYGYDELNLNVGCPSGRVQNGRFGACLMAAPDLVAACVAALRRATNLPVTVKTRIGIDASDSYAFLRNFMETVAAAGCETFIVHARKALLAGLSPRQNREIPPLNYARVYRLKDDFPQLAIVLNGGICDTDQAFAHLEHVDGVMIGRAAYTSPYFLAELENAVLRPNGDWEPPDRAELVRRMARYARERIQEGGRLHHVTRHMLGLFAGEPGARRWRRHLSTECCRADAREPELLAALEAV